MLVALPTLWPKGPIESTVYTFQVAPPHPSFPDMDSLFQLCVAEGELYNFSAGLLCRIYDVTVVLKVGVLT